LRIEHGSNLSQRKWGEREKFAKGSSIIREADFVEAAAYAERCPYIM